MSELEIGGVSEEIFAEFDAFDCAGSDNSTGSLFFTFWFYYIFWFNSLILATIQALATRLLAEDDYQMKCVEYFNSLSDDCKYIELKFPYFNLIFLVGYIILLGIQVICMLKHR